MFSTNSIFQVNNVRFRYSKYEISKKKYLLCCEIPQDFQEIKKKSKHVFR